MSGLAKKPEDRPATCLAVLDGKGLGRVERADGANMTDAPRASVRVHPPNASLNHPAAMDGDSSFPQTQKGRSKTGIVIVVGILALLASLGAGSLWLMLGRTEASDAVMTPDPAKVSADAIFSEARSNMAACTRLDLGDGFKERVEECQSSLDNAKVQYDLGHWSAAAGAFTNVAEKCRTLIAADVERDNAKTAASLLSESIKAAKDAEAQKFAKIRYESAAKMANRGRAEFGDFKFAAAAATYEQAKGLFDLAAQEAGKSKQEETEAAERSEAAKIRAEAIVQRGKVERISDSEGFKERKNRLEDVFTRAEAYYRDDARQWLEANACFREYIEQGEALVQLDKERKDAVAKRKAAQVSFKKAEEDGAKTHAKENWNAAVSTWNKAAEEMKRMEFVEAAETFSKARSEFDACGKEAQMHRGTGQRGQPMPITGLPTSPRPAPMETRRKVCLYEARYIPFVIENGNKKYVSASPAEALPVGLSQRVETISGRSELVLGTNALPGQAFRVELKYGRYSAKIWIASSTFNKTPDEIELRYNR